MPKLAILTLALVVGLFFLSGQTSQVAAYSSTPQGNTCYGYYYGYYNYSYYWWYYGYYPYNYYYYPYYSCYYYYGGYYYYYPYSYSYYSTPSKYELTVATDPAEVGGGTGSGTYTSGSTASFSVSTSIVQTSPNTRYVFSHWTGDYSGVGTSGSITMNSAKKVVAVYQLQYYLDVSAQPQTAPLPQGEGWYNAGDSTALTVSGQILDSQDGGRLVFQGWNMDGQNLQGGVSFPVKMDTPHTVVAQYKQQYYLKVLADQGTPYGEGWYDEGTTAQIYASTPPSTTWGVSWVFNGWQGGAESNSQTSSVLMDSPKTVVASWRSDPTLLNMTIIAAVAATILVVVAIVAFLALGRRRNPPYKYLTQYQQPSLTPVASSGATSMQETKPKPFPKKKAVPESHEPDESNNQ